MRAVLLAKATATSILGLRANILASHGSVVSPRRIACRTTAVAPVINNRRRSRWPIFDFLPSLGLPPVVCCRGTRPSQAEKSRPRRKLSIGGAKACSAIAVTGPIPGIFINRTVSSSSRALARSSTVEFIDLVIELVDSSDQQPAQLDDCPRQARVPVFENPGQLPDPGPALRSDHAILGQVTPKHIDRLRTLSHRQVARAKEHPLRLLRLGLDCHEVYGRSLRSLRDRLRVGRVVLVA